MVEILGAKTCTESEKLARRLMVFTTRIAVEYRMLSPCPSFLLLHTAPGKETHDADIISRFPISQLQGMALPQTLLVILAYRWYGRSLCCHLLVD